MFSNACRPPGVFRASRALLVALVALAFIAPGFESATAQVTVTPITHGDHFAPDIEGDRVVYVDNESGNCDLFLYDLSTGMRKRIVNSSHADTDPKISGDNVVYRSWYGWDPYNHAIPSHLWCYSISRDESYALDTGIASVSDFAVSGDTVAFSAPDGNTEMGSVMTLDMSTGATETIFTSPDYGTPFDLAIAGDYVAFSFEPENDTPPSLCLANLSTDTTKVIDTDAESACVTSDGAVVYRWYAWDSDPEWQQVRRYDSNSRTTTTLFSGGGRPVDVSDGRLLYYDPHSAYSPGLYVYNLAAKTRVKISSPKDGRGGTAHMSGTKVVWDDPRYTTKYGWAYPPNTPGHWMDYDVYSATYSAPMFSLGCPKGVTYGRRATITGKVTDTTGTAYTGKVTLQQSTNDKTWHSVATKATSSSGRFSFTSGTVKRATYFRVKFVRSSKVTYSFSVKVMPRAVVSRPTVVSLLPAIHPVPTITGKVTPSGSKRSEVVAYVSWKRSNGTWTAEDAFSAEASGDAKYCKLTAHKGYSTYRLSLRSPRFEPHRWRVRVRAKSAAKGTTWGVSPYTYFTVR